MDSYFLSHRFLAWLTRAGWVASRFDAEIGAFDEDGDCAVWEEDENGKTITGYILHVEDDGWVSAKVRPGSAPFLTANALDVVERYFWGLLGGVIRHKCGLAALAPPGEVPPNYHIADGALVDQAGNVVAKAEADHLTPLSRYLAAPLDELEASFLSPAGKPLFTLA